MMKKTDSAADKVELYFENLEAPISKDWTDVEANNESTFTPSVKQWNYLVNPHQVKSD
jgi:hypothetical protein